MQDGETRLDAEGRQDEPWREAREAAVEWPDFEQAEAQVTGLDMQTDGAREQQQTADDLCDQVAVAGAVVSTAVILVGGEVVGEARSYSESICI